MLKVPHHIPNIFSWKLDEFEIALGEKWGRDKSPCPPVLLPLVQVIEILMEKSARYGAFCLVPHRRFFSWHGFDVNSLILK